MAVDKRKWKKLHQKVVDCLPSAAREVLTPGKWQDINRIPFAKTLDAVCKHHGIMVSLSDLKLFTRIRNTIVHSLRYDLSIQLPDHWKMPNRPQAAMHFFVANFVDRVILQLFGLGTHLESTP